MKGFPAKGAFIFPVFNIIYNVHYLWYEWRPIQILALTPGSNRTNLRTPSFRVRQCPPICLISTTVSH
jgi:hypothetical protein